MGACLHPIFQPQFNPISGVFNHGHRNLILLNLALKTLPILFTNYAGRLAERQVTNVSLRAFTALADGDQAIGMLAFYLWRRRARRQYVGSEVVDMAIFLQARGNMLSPRAGARIRSADRNDLPGQFIDSS